MKNFYDPPYHIFHSELFSPIIIPSFILTWIRSIPFICATTYMLCKFLVRISMKSNQADNFEQ